MSKDQQLIDSYNHCLNQNNKLEMELKLLKLSVRDKFATAAMNAFVSKGDWPRPIDLVIESYEIADMMIKVRVKDESSS